MFNLLSEFQDVFKKNICFSLEPTRRTIEISDNYHFYINNVKYNINKGNYFLSFPKTIFSITYYSSYLPTECPEDGFHIQSSFIVNNILYYIPLYNIYRNKLCIGKEANIELMNYLFMKNDNFISSFLDLFWQTSYSNDYYDNLLYLYSKGFSLDEWQRKTKEDKDYIIEEKYLQLCIQRNDNECLFKHLNM